MGVREGHSRPAALRAEEPGSASLHTEPALFSVGWGGEEDTTVPLVSPNYSRVPGLEVPTSQ